MGWVIVSSDFTPSSSNGLGPGLSRSNATSPIMRDPYRSADLGNRPLNKRLPWNTANDFLAHHLSVSHPLGAKPTVFHQQSTRTLSLSTVGFDFSVLSRSGSPV